MWYYLSRGMDINDFGPLYRFLLEWCRSRMYAVIGRVARKIWAKAMKINTG
jgi:methylmalonyl-CoA mutase